MRRYARRGSPSSQGGRAQGVTSQPQGQGLYQPGDGGPEGIRTPDLAVKSRLLYRTELRAHGTGRLTRTAEDKVSGAATVYDRSRSSAAPTMSGKRTVTSPSTVTCRAVALSFPQEIASRVLAPERLPSHSTAVVR